MITPFRLGDALRCMLVNAPGGTNLAAPTESVVRCRPLRNSTFWRQSIARNPNRVTVGDWNGMDLSSLASARVRSGVRAWEVDRLYLKDSSQTVDLLEEVICAAGARGAERLFLRVPCDSEIVGAARRAGFFAYYEEIHLTGLDWSGSDRSGYDGAGADRPERAGGSGENANGHQNGIFGRFAAAGRTEPDKFGLFQLYCAATPQRVREGIGLTIDQWSDSQEPARHHSDEAVLTLDGKVVGWRMCEPFGETAAGRVLAHPDHPDVMPHLVQMSYNTLNWLAPSFQENAVDLLTRQGLHEAGRYIMLIKTLTVPVSSREFSYVEA